MNLQVGDRFQYNDRQEDGTIKERYDWVIVRIETLIDAVNQGKDEAPDQRVVLYMADYES